MKNHLTRRIGLIWICLVFAFTHAQADTPATTASSAFEGTIEKESIDIPIEVVRLQAERGDPEAQVRMGTLYGAGEAVSKDEAEAVRWYRMAANQDNANAQYNLGIMYLNGRGVPQNYEKAKDAFETAAENGVGMASEMNEAVALAREIFLQEMADWQVNRNTFRRRAEIHRKRTPPAGIDVPRAGLAAANGRVVFRIENAAGSFIARVWDSPAGISTRA